MRTRNKWLVMFAVAVTMNSVASVKVCESSQTGSIKALTGDTAVKNSVDLVVNNPKTPEQPDLSVMANGKPRAGSAEKVEAPTPNVLKQGGSKDSRRVIPVRRGNKRNRQRKDLGKSNVLPETAQPSAKQEKKPIKKNLSNPAGRPDLKPEFAKPDRAPGPPLGDHAGDNEKQKRR
ncbi:MAG: hypothetical protein M1511_19130 [Deltaproteobacteria bacterium]|nr:hypothetical protein [Deltaproteobacteria bacterium]